MDKHAINGANHTPVAMPLAAYTRLSPARPTKVFDTYWQFAAERQRIFFRRINGDSPPYTSDPVLQRFKFTNAYRASDRVSQYLIQQVLYRGDQSPQEIFFRALLFKFFNRIETWELLSHHVGEVRYVDYSFEQYDLILSRAMSHGAHIFSGAYIMPSGRADFTSPRKHQSYLWLLETMMRDEVPARISEARSMRQAFEILRSYPLMGDFLAYQYVTDLNYSTLVNFSETEFVIPGPGARDGIRKCFATLGGLNEADIIKVIAERQTEEFERLGLAFLTLWGRSLKLIDCQNLLCEVDKYARVVHPDVTGTSKRTRIKQTFRPSRSALRYWYPPKWNINHLIPDLVRATPNSKFDSMQQEPLFGKEVTT